MKTYICLVCETCQMQPLWISAAVSVGHRLSCSVPTDAALVTDCPLEATFPCKSTFLSRHRPERESTGSKFLPSLMGQQAHMFLMYLCDLLNAQTNHGVTERRGIFMFHSSGEHLNMFPRFLTTSLQHTVTTHRAGRVKPCVLPVFVVPQVALQPQLELSQHICVSDQSVTVDRRGDLCPCGCETFVKQTPGVSCYSRSITEHVRAAKLSVPLPAAVLLRLCPSVRVF